MVQRLSRFSVGQTAKVLAILYGLIGLIITPFLALGVWLAPEEAGFGFGFVLLFPILYAVLTFIATAVGCALYNWAARLVGGIEIELDTARGS